MLSIIFSACVLMGVTVAVHTAGLAVLMRLLVRLPALPPARHWPTIRMLLRIIWWLVLLHLVEISVWGAFYLWRGCLPDAETAFYFSGVTYTTVGYGDVVLAKPWRLLAPIEGLAGILMFSLSTGYFFLVVSAIHQSRHVKSTAISTSADGAEQP
jgi:ABC-type anion transport system duplicated permease subunit